MCFIDFHGLELALSVDRCGGFRYATAHLYKYRQEQERASSFASERPPFGEYNKKVPIETGPPLSSL